MGIIMKKIVKNINLIATICILSSCLSTKVKHENNKKEEIIKKNKELTSDKEDLLSIKSKGHISLHKKKLLYEVKAFELNASGFFKGFFQDNDNDLDFQNFNDRLTEKEEDFISIFREQLKELEKELEIRKPQMSFFKKMHYKLSINSIKSKEYGNKIVNLESYDIGVTKQSIERIKTFSNKRKNVICNYIDDCKKYPLDFCNTEIMKNYNIFCDKDKRGKSCLKRIGLDILKDIKDDNKKCTVTLVTGNAGIGKTFLGQLIEKDVKNTLNKNVVTIYQSEDINISNIKERNPSCIIWDDIGFNNLKGKYTKEEYKVHKDFRNLIELIKYCEEQKIPLYISSNYSNIKQYLERCSSLCSESKEVSDDYKQYIKPFLEENNDRYRILEFNSECQRKGLIDGFFDNKIYNTLSDKALSKDEKILRNVIKKFSKSKYDKNQKEHVNSEYNEKEKPNGGVIFIPKKFIEKHTVKVGTKHRIKIGEYYYDIDINDFYKQEGYMKWPILHSIQRFMHKTDGKESGSIKKYQNYIKSIRNLYFRKIPTMARENFDNKKLTFIVFDNEISEILKEKNNLNPSINQVYNQVIDPKIGIKDYISDGDQTTYACSATMANPFDIFLFGQHCTIDKEERSFRVGYKNRLSKCMPIFNYDTNNPSSYKYSKFTGIKTESKWVKDGLVKRILGVAMNLAFMTFKGIVIYKILMKNHFIYNFTHIGTSIRWGNFTIFYILLQIGLLVLNALTNNIVDRRKYHLPSWWENTIDTNFRIWFPT